MKYKLLSLALALVALLPAVKAQAQTAVGVGTSGWNPGGMTLQQGTIANWLDEGSTAGFLEYVGSTHQQEWNNSGTFNLCGGLDYLKMLVPNKRSGALTVKYVTSREVTQTLLLDDIKTTGWGNKDHWDKTAYFKEAWSAYAIWLRGHTITSVTIKVAAGNTANISLETIYSDDSYNQTVSVAAGATAETTLTLTIPAEHREAFDQFYIRATTTGQAEFNEISYTEIIDAPQPLIKINTTDNFDSAQVVNVTTGQDGNFNTVTYDYTTTANTYIYVSRGQIRSLSITSAVSTVLPAALTTIDDNTTWQSMGTGMWTQLRPNNGNAKIWLTDYAGPGVDYASAAAVSANNALAESARPGYSIVQNDTEAGIDADNKLNNAQVIINGSKPYIDRAVTDVNTSKFTSNNGVGFKLKANSKFRIQIFCDRVNLDANQLLKTGGADMEHASYVTGGYVTNIATSTGDATNTRLVTFDVTTGAQDQAYWVLPGAGDLNVGAVQVLLDNQVSANRADVLNGQINRTIKIEFVNNGNKQAKTDVDGNYTINYLESGKQLKCTDNSSNIYAYVYGPAMAFNSITYPTCNVVMLNSGNSICIGQVPTSGTVSIPFIADTGNGLKLMAGENRATATQVKSSILDESGYGELVWPNDLGYNTFVWIEAAGNSLNPQDFIYISEVSVKLRRAPSTTPIDGDFIWRSRPNEDLPENNTFEGGYLFNYNDAETAQSTEMVVNGTSVPTRDLTQEGDGVYFRIADNLQGEIRIYYSGDQPTLNRGDNYMNATTGVTGTDKAMRENSNGSGGFVNDYMSYSFTTSDAKYYKVTGNIASIQVLVATTPAGGTQNVIDSDMSLWVTDNLGTTISKGAAKLVANSGQYLDENNYSLYTGVDNTLNSTQIEDHTTITLDQNQNVKYRFAKGIYTITVYFGKTINSAGLTIVRNDKGRAYYKDISDDNYTEFAYLDNTSQDLGNTHDYSNLGHRVIRYDLSGIRDNEYGELSINSWNDGIVYFAGIDVVAEKPKIEFVTADQAGIFTGRYKGKLLVYCTDNGTLENFRVPVVNYKEGTNRTPITASTTPTFQLVKQHYNANAGTMPVSPSIVADGTFFKVSGFEDTDIDQLYKVTYTHNGVSDFYYLWFSNYLKTGWWTGHDAKLIVGSDVSANDPDHIITGEFYVSSGSMGTLYYQAPDDTGFSGVDYVYTADNNTTAMRNIAKATSDDEHANEDAINLAWPSAENMSKWTGDVTKFVEFAAHRSTTSTVDQTGYEEWPDFTIKLTFHFIPAPAITMTPNSPANGTNTVTFTTYNGTKTAVAGQTVYYTTDGTRPGSTSPTSAGGQSVTNKFSATYYAAEKITTARQFYKINPYTTHREGKSPLDLMTESSNKSTDFYAISSVCYSPVTDTRVDYIDMNTGFLSRATNLTGGTAFDGTTITGEGGVQYNYPVGSNASNRQMTVKFGNTDLKVLQGSQFKEGGINWSLVGRLQYPFDEHLDCMQYDNNNTDLLMGYNDGTYNGDPRSECNGGPGGPWTETVGRSAPFGMFLTPITGDFLRFEPQYDGVVTLWIRQNGAGQGNEVAEGNLTRRPVYIMDENGKIMKRSTIKPTSEHFFGIDGVYAEIDEVKGKLRADFRTAWMKGLSRWNTTNDQFGNRNKSAFRLLNTYYGLPMYQRFNREGHSGNNMRYTFDLADSWVSRTANVESVVCDYSPMYYRSDNAQTHCEVNVKFDQTLSGNALDANTGTSVNDGAGFANYGWEVPTYNIVRYRFPVHAGKTYFVAGRDTKNGFVAVKLDPLTPNYNPADYVHSHNRTTLENSFETASVTTGSLANADYNPADNMDLYRQMEEGAEGGTRDFGIAMYCQWNEGVDRPNYGVINSGNIDQTKSVKLTQREFKANYWYGIVLPFSVSETKLKEVFGDDVRVLFVDPYENSMNGHHEWNQPWYSAINPGVDYIDNNNSNGLTLKLTHHYYQMIYANVPCFISASRYVSEPEFGNVHIEAANLPVANDFTKLGYKIGEAGNYEYFITGSYYKGDHFDTDIYYMANYDGGIGADNTAVVYHAQNGVRFEGTRAWIEARPKSGSSGAPGKAPLISMVGFNTFDDVDGNTQSGICDIVADEENIEFNSTDENVYDVMGRVVAVGSTAGLPNGVYVYKGKKVYIHN